MLCIKKHMKRECNKSYRSIFHNVKCNPVFDHLSKPVDGDAVLGAEAGPAGRRTSSG